MNKNNYQRTVQNTRFLSSILIEIVFTFYQQIHHAYALCGLHLMKYRTEIGTQIINIDKIIIQYGYFSMYRKMKSQRI